MDHISFKISINKSYIYFRIQYLQKEIPQHDL